MHQHPLGHLARVQTVRGVDTVLTRQFVRVTQVPRPVLGTGGGLSFSRHSGIKQK